MVESLHEAPPAGVFRDPPFERLPRFDGSLRALNSGLRAGTQHAMVPMFDSSLTIRTSELLAPDRTSYHDITYTPQIFTFTPLSGCLLESVHGIGVVMDSQVKSPFAKSPRYIILIMQQMLVLLDWKI